MQLVYEVCLCVATEICQCQRALLYVYVEQRCRLAIYSVYASAELHKMSAAFRYRNVRPCDISVATVYDAGNLLTNYGLDKTSNF